MFESMGPWHDPGGFEQREGQAGFNGRVHKIARWSDPVPIQDARLSAWNRRCVGDWNRWRTRLGRKDG
jgi:hypothetical protein